MFGFFTFVLLFLSAVFFPQGGIFASGSVLINEVAWMGTSVSANDEWFELYNSGSSAVSLEGWRLASADGTPDIALSGSIPAGGYFLLERTDDDTVSGIAADQIYTGALGNGGEHLVLYDGTGVVVDEINASGGWPAGDNSTKETMQRAGADWLTAAATPRAQNQGIPQEEEEEDEQLSPAPSSSSSGPAFVAPAIYAYAGEDRTAVVGSSVSFSGAAYNAKKEPLDPERFLWNFGDGSVAEGRNVSHVFRAPGTYTVGLHVSSGGASASDYAALEIVSNQLAVTGVTGGEEGGLRLKNPSQYLLDIGGWSISDAAGNSFIIPALTKIAPRAEIAFTNALTGLFRMSASAATVYYANGAAAIRYEPQTPPFSAVVGSNTEEARTSVSSQQEAENEEAIVAAEQEHSGIAESSAGNEAAAAVFSGASGRMFFWFAAAISVLAAIGFLMIRKFA